MQAFGNPTIRRAARVLVVDDNQRNVKLLEGMLTSQGYEVIPAYSGPEALDKAGQHPPDLIISDILMPGMDGFELTQVLRSQPATRPIPILMLTALREMEHKTQALESGADDFLTKPFSLVELLVRVRALLRIKFLHDELDLKNKVLERVLMRYISEEIAHEILADPEQNLQLGGQARQVSVLFADIRGFTHFAEQREAALVTDVLNRIFNSLAPLVLECNGTLDKFMGDAIMAFYGAPVVSVQHPIQAVRTAWKMQQRFAHLYQEIPPISDGRLGVGIGIYTGEAVVGNIGSEKIMNYTVIGNTPNMAKRLQENARAGQILIGATTYQAVQGLVQVQRTEPLNLKGMNEPVQAYHVLAVEES
jgi:class 3 adenylate cyclase